MVPIEIDFKQLSGQFAALIKVIDAHIQDILALQKILAGSLPATTSSLSIVREGQIATPEGVLRVKMEIYDLERRRLAAIQEINAKQQLLDEYSHMAAIQEKRMVEELSEARKEMKPQIAIAKKLLENKALQIVYSDPLRLSLKVIEEMRKKDALKGRAKAVAFATLKSRVSIATKSLLAE